MLLARQDREAGAGLLIRRARASGLALARVALVLGVAGCAQIALPGAATNNPQAQYHVARMAEGAYLASPNVDPEVLRRLAELDYAARHAVDRWRAQQDEETQQAAATLVAELTDFLRAEAPF